MGQWNDKLLLPGDQDNKSLFSWNNRRGCVWLVRLWLWSAVNSPRSPCSEYCSSCWAHWIHLLTFYLRSSAAHSRCFMVVFSYLSWSRWGTKADSAPLSWQTWRSGCSPCRAGAAPRCPGSSAHWSQKKNPLSLTRPSGCSWSPRSKW